ncbi:MAG: hypothetical protein NT142_08980 [Planctomycetota bacterium]|nr:hypothetical protein [Planctomycetota bacterium]
METSLLKQPGCAEVDCKGGEGMDWSGNQIQGAPDGLILKDVWTFAKNRIQTIFHEV